MTAKRWERLKHIFEQANELPPREREAFLDRFCGDDAPLHKDARELLNADAAAGAFLDLAAACEPDPTLTPGQVLADRFEIVGLLGRGGMGEVYEVEDLRLGTRVALKTFPRELAGAEAAAGLLSEIRHSRKVTHPNVCRVFDAGSGDGPSGPIVFFTMELLSGETLSAAIKDKGPLPREQAERVAAQIADGLDAAHRAGVIHRDLKSANVMLTFEPGGEIRAVVSDFGLAREKNRFTQEISGDAGNWLIGTPAYMAPELLRGELASSASDIYAFGVVLCELFTGAKPGEASKRAVPTAWRKPIVRCLHPRPAQRWSRAGAAIAARRRRTSRTKFLLAAAAALIGVALFAAVLRISPWVRIPETGTLMIADVANSTGQSRFDALSWKVRSQLAQSARFDLWDERKREAALESMAKPVSAPLRGDLAREVAKRQGARYLLFLGIAPSAGGWVLSYQLEKTGPHSMLRRGYWIHSIRVDSESRLDNALHDGCSWVRRTLGEDGTELAAHDSLPEDTTTSSWEALDLFSQAERALTLNQRPRALALLREAVQRDPHFALAYMRLGDVEMSVRQHEEGLHFWDVALSEANVRHLTLREKLRIRGLYAEEVRDYAGAEAAFSKMEEEYPRDYLASFYLGNALRWEGRLTEAIAKFSAADQKNPGSGPVLANLAGTYLLAREFEKLKSLVDRERRQGDRGNADHYTGLLEFANNRIPGALVAFDREANSSDIDRRSRGEQSLAALLCETGRTEDARALLTRSIASDLQSGRAAQKSDKLLMLAYIDFKAGRQAEARREIREATEEVSPERYARGATMLARMGLAADARRLFERLKGYPDSPLMIVTRRRIEGEIALQSGDAKRGIRILEQAAAAEPALRPRDYLARAYLSAGDFDRAVPILRRLAETPSLLWETIGLDDPGILTDLLPELARAANRVGDRETAKLATNLFKIRRNSSEFIE